MRWEGVPALLFRMANERGNQIVEAQIHLVLARDEFTPEGESFRQLHDLELIRSQHTLFALTWTAVHPITAQSPLAGATPASLAAADTEIIVSLIGFDETFSQTVHARYSYTARDIVWGPGLSMYHPAFPTGSGASTTHGFMTLFGSIRHLKNGPPLTSSAIRGSVAGLDFRFNT